MAGELGVPPLDVKVVPADTDRFGEGHGFNTAPSPGTGSAVTSAAGKIRDKASGREVEWKKACAMLGSEKAKAKGSWTYGESIRKENAGISKVGVGGVQVAEVLVDT